MIPINVAAGAASAIPVSDASGWILMMYDIGNLIKKDWINP